MNETTTMLANTIKLILGSTTWVSSPQLSIESKIDELIEENLEKEFIGYDEFGDKQYKIGEPKNKKLDKTLKLLKIVADKDRSEVRRYTDSKVEIIENKFKTVRKIVDKYSDIEEDQ